MPQPTHAIRRVNASSPRRRSTYLGLFGEQQKLHDELKELKGVLHELKEYELELGVGIEPSLGGEANPITGTVDMGFKLGGIGTLQRQVHIARELVLFRRAKMREWPGRKSCRVSRH